MGPPRDNNGYGQGEDKDSAECTSSANCLTSQSLQHSQLLMSVEMSMPESTRFTIVNVCCDVDEGGSKTSLKKTA